MLPETGGFFAPFDLMKFTLSFEGRLPAAGNRNHRVSEKWSIRRSLHPQFEELWNVSTLLRRMKRVEISADGSHLQQTVTIPTNTHGGFRAIPERRKVFEPIEVKGHHFVPLVRRSVSTMCTLDILFLRKEEPGSLISQGGDVDNRIKTLFDALRMPTSDDFTGAETDEGELPQPFYCLLESDALITGFNIKTDRLLTKPNSHPSEVHLVIEVIIKVMEVGTHNMWLLGD